MIKQIRMENFRKHLNVTIDLTEGVNAFRAPNEQGKSTCIEALTYVMSGAKGLKDPLEDVVTTGLPVGKLKAGITIEIDGVTYEAKRSKAGAEITFGKEIITGQTECTKFFERLMGCSADMSSQLMIAEQSALKGALEDGPTAAGKMIEDLANFDLIDTVIELMQDRLVLGNTAAAEARVDLATSQAQEVVLAPTGELESALAEATQALSSAKASLAQAKEGVPASAEVQAAQKILATSKALLDQEIRLRAQIEQLNTLLSVELPSAPSEGAIAKLREDVAASKEAVHLKALKAGLEKLDTVAQWKGDLASLQAEVAKHEGKPAQLASDGHASAVKVAQLEGKLIKETSCAFCQKDLSDVPEVVQINSALAPQIAEQKAIYEQCAKDKKETEDYLQMLRAVLKHEMSISSALSRCAEHITLDRTNVPTTYTWTTEIKEAADASSDLAKAERALTARVMAEARAEVNKASLTRSEQELAEAAIAQENLPCKASAQGVIDQQVEGAKALELAHADLQAATVREAADKSALSRAVDANNRAMTEQAKAKAALQVMHIELAAMRENNALIKKVRLARPQITDKLWTVVLGAVSTYFSQVRGFPSIVTRESNKFKVNGVAVGGGGLSGSAKDALGLAMRIALVKMFLPNSSFMVLDEMAAACDDERETTMLGLVSTAGFKQIILVTHSDLADAFCDNIITL